VVPLPAASFTTPKRKRSKNVSKKALYIKIHLGIHNHPSPIETYQYQHTTCLNIPNMYVSTYQRSHRMTTPDSLAAAAAAEKEFQNKRSPHSNTPSTSTSTSLPRKASVKKKSTTRAPNPNITHSGCTEGLKHSPWIIKPHLRVHRPKQSLHTQHCRLDSTRLFWDTWHT